MTKLDYLIQQEVEAKIETPFVTERFGDNWQDYAKSYDDETLRRIAWKQGRKAILLERLLRKLASNPEILAQ